MKNNSGISGEHNLSPANESLSPYLYGLSPAYDMPSSEDNPVSITKSGENGDNGDKSGIVAEEGNDSDYPKGLCSNIGALI